MSDIDRLSFTEDGHSYSLDGEPIWSITTILNALDPIPEAIRCSEKFILACEFGTEVHEHTEADDLGKPREPERMGGAYECADKWRQWVSDNDVEILEVELPVFSEKYWYSGRIDRLVKLNGKVYVIDIKSGKYSTRHSYQVTGYVMAAREMGYHIDGGAVVSLPADEPAKFHDIKIIKYMPKWVEKLYQFTDMQFGGFYEEKK